MNLMSTLWFVAGACALILAVDTFLVLLRPSRLFRVRSSSRLVPFGIVMVIIAIACSILGLYEAGS
jgi:hypothetical protein